MSAPLTAPLRPRGSHSSALSMADRMRRRTDPRLGRLTLACLALCASLGYLAGISSLATLPTFSAAPLLLVVVSVVLYLLPLTYRGVRHSFRRGLLQNTLESLSLLSHMGCVAALCMLGGVEVFIGALLLGLGHLVVNWERTDAAYFLVLLSLLLTHVAQGVAPGTMSLVVLLVSFPACYCALAMLNGRAAREAGLKARPERGLPFEPPGLLSRRLTMGLLFALLALLLAFVTHHATNVQPRQNPEEPNRRPPQDEGTQPPGERNPQGPPDDEIEGERNDPGSTQRDPEEQPGEPEEERPREGSGEAGEGRPEPPQPEFGEPRFPRTGDQDEGQEPDPTFEEILQSIINPNRPGARPIDVGATFRQGTSNLFAPIRDPLDWRVPLAILLQVLLFLWIARKLMRRRKERSRTAPGGDLEGDFYLQKLLKALQPYGHQLREPETPREFTRRIVRRRGVAFAGCTRITDLLYRHHFGGTPLTDDERREIEGIIRDLGRQ